MNNSSTTALFYATETFRSQERGDLNFEKGELIVGLHERDANWWSGVRLQAPSNPQGIFPLTFVRQVSIADPIRSRSIAEFRPSYQGELSFGNGEDVFITGAVNSEWLSGYTLASQGMFPSNFVEIDKEQPVEHVVLNRTCRQRFMSNSSIDDIPPISSPPVDAQNGNYSIQFDALPQQQYSTTSFPTGSPLPFSEPQSQQWIPEPYYATEAWPAAFNGAGTQSSSAFSSDDQQRPYGVALHPFTAEAANELSLRPNDVVHLIQHINEEWTEGEIEGKRGSFPTSFVQIIVDCAAKTAKEQTARVKFTFQAERSQELTVFSGDTVKVIRDWNEEWLFVMDISGLQGLVPKCFLEFDDHDEMPRVFEDGILPKPAAPVQEKHGDVLLEDIVKKEMAEMKKATPKPAPSRPPPPSPPKARKPPPPSPPKGRKPPRPSPPPRRANATPPPPPPTPAQHRRPVSPPKIKSPDRTPPVPRSRQVNLPSRPAPLPPPVGQRVNVIQFHDEDGDEQWWLVNNEQGDAGFVPANYLGPLSAS